MFNSEKILYDKMLKFRKRMWWHFTSNKWKYLPIYILLPFELYQCFTKLYKEYQEMFYWYSATSAFKYIRRTFE